MHLQGQVCLVTGASRGIGAAIAGQLAAEGARIALHYGRSKDRAEALLGQLAGAGHFTIGADLADLDQVSTLVPRVLETAGRLDVLVNNAGIFEAHPPLDSDAEHWQRSWQHTIGVNLMAPALLSQAAAQAMAAAGGGRIINIGSRGAFRGEPDCPAYAASKAGLHAMSQSLALALGARGVLVFAIAPGFVATEMAQSILDSSAGDAVRAQSPFKRVARPEEVAETVRFLATTSAEFLSGGIIDLNGASYLRS